VPLGSQTPRADEVTRRVAVYVNLVVVNGRKDKLFFNDF